MISWCFDRDCCFLLVWLSTICLDWLFPNRKTKIMDLGWIWNDMFWVYTKTDPFWLHSDGNLTKIYSDTSSIQCSDCSPNGCSLHLFYTSPQKVYWIPTPKYIFIHRLPVPDSLPSCSTSVSTPLSLSLVICSYHLDSGYQYCYFEFSGFCLICFETNTNRYLYLACYVSLPTKIVDELSILPMCCRCRVRCIFFFW